MADLGIYTSEIKGSLDEPLEEIKAPAIVIIGDESTTKQDQEKPLPVESSQTPQATEKIDGASQQDISECLITQEDNENPQEDETMDDDMTDQESEGETMMLDDTLLPLEKLVRFSSSPLVLQRIVITRDLSTIIQSISLEDAVNTALPIVLQLGKDPEDSVREALASELDKIIYFYYQNAPPVHDSTQFHIPAHTFVVTIIEFLLDQNTTLASMAQQSVVTVAAELAEASKGTEKYDLHQALLDQEIFEGVVCGLIAIFDEKMEDNNEIIDNYQKDEGKQSEEDTTLVGGKGTTDGETTTVFTTVSKMALKNYDNGGMNLAKMVCLMLISALAPVFGPERCNKKLLPIVESMATDQMFYVRKEAATAVGSLSTVLTPDVTLERLLPLYRKLAIDTIWHVRRSCVFALPLIADVLPADTKAAIAVEGVELFQNDVSRNVRNSLADIVGELISKFLPEDWKETGHPGQVPEQLVDFFLSLGNMNNVGTNQMFKLDIERVHNCAYNFPAVVLTAGVSYWDHRLKETYLNLTKDYQLKVRRTFAYSLHEIARIIGPERTERDLVQIFALYLMDLDDVKQGVLEHLSEFLAVLAASSRNDYIPILTEVWDGVMSNWHLRDILTNQLCSIARLFDAARVVEHILPLALRACHDEFAAVRESGVEIFPVILDIVKRTVDEGGENLSHIDMEESEGTEDNIFERQQKFALALLSHVMEKLDELVKSSAYRIRLVFTQICRSLLEAGINPTDFASFFLPRLAILAKDPIVNIRIATSRTIRMLCSIDGYSKELESIPFTENASIYDDECNPGLMLDEILYYLSTDSDEDVCYFVLDFVSPEKLNVYRKRREVEELDIAQQKRQQEDSKVSTITLPPPPTPPVHLIVYPNEDQDDIMKEEHVFFSLREENTASPMEQEIPKEELNNKASLSDVVSAEDTMMLDTVNPEANKTDTPLLL